MTHTYSVGLDFGSNSVRTIIVDTATGQETGSHAWAYSHGDQGIIKDRNIPNMARQHPSDYLEGMEQSIKGALSQADMDASFSREHIVSIGVAATGSTPLPVDKTGMPLAFSPAFHDNPHAMAWLWKDHTSIEEAAEITKLASDIRPQYLDTCGGRYSSEWFWSKALHCLRTAPEVFAAADTWVELSDWIPALLTGPENSLKFLRNSCAAGHKALFHASWQGYPDDDFLRTLDKGLVRLRHTLPDQTTSIAKPAGRLTSSWAKKLELPAGITVAMGGIDAHMGSVGAGIRQGMLVKIIGTSSCDMMITPQEGSIPQIPGLAGIASDSILPGFYGLEAGQAAVGDIFNWCVNVTGHDNDTVPHKVLTEAAGKLKAGQSGLLCLDWHNGNRSILADQQLSGMILGLTLHTRPAEIYRALIESTAFGARMIIERLESCGIPVNRVVNCGGIASKNPVIMQIYADVTGRPMELSRSEQTCALGAAIAGAVAAGKVSGGHDNFDDALKAMTGIRKNRYIPETANRKIYDRIFSLYHQVHNAFGTSDEPVSQGNVMKDLIRIRKDAIS